MYTMLKSVSATSAGNWAERKPRKCVAAEENDYHNRDVTGLNSQDEHVSSSASCQGLSAVALISKSIAELGDWRTLIKQVEPDVVEALKWRGTPNLVA